MSACGPELTFPYIGESPLLGEEQTSVAVFTMSGNDAVDGAHSEASECHRVVALKHTTMRGAVHGRGYHNRSRYCEVGIPGSRRRRGWGGGYSQACQSGEAAGVLCQPAVVPGRHRGLSGGPSLESRAAGTWPHGEADATELCEGLSQA